MSATLPSTLGAAAERGSIDEEVSHWHAWRASRSEEAREALLAKHLPYARTVAATYYGRRQHNEIEFGDYLQYARIGLLEAMDRYDPGLGAGFRTFAARRMHGAILDGIEKLTEKQQQIAVQQRLRSDRVAMAKDAAANGRPSKTGKARDADDLFRYLAEVGIGLAICRLLEGTGMVDDEAAPALPPDRPYQAVELAHLRRRLVEAIDGLAPQQRTVIRYHYVQEHPFEQIATLLDLTRGRISQIHRQALDALRARLSSSDSCDVSW